MYKVWLIWKGMLVSIENDTNLKHLRTFIYMVYKVTVNAPCVKFYPNWSWCLSYELWTFKLNLGLYKVQIMYKLHECFVLKSNYNIFPCTPFYKSTLIMWCIQRMKNVHRLPTTSTHIGNLKIKLPLKCFDQLLATSRHTCHL